MNLNVFSQSQGYARHGVLTGHAERCRCCVLFPSLARRRARTMFLQPLGPVRDYSAPSGARRLQAR